MFKKITAKNFLSWENLEFHITDGVTLIEGFNYDDQTSEGSGKSSIVNALCWGLYGKLPKTAKVDDVIREGTKSCTVEIDLTSGMKITRSRKPNKLFLSTDKNDKIMGKDAKETQIMIDDHIGMSFETFVQSVYFAQNYPKKFITATEEERVRILSEILDLKIFDRVRMQVQKNHKTLEAESIVLKGSIQADERIECELHKKLNDYKDLQQTRIASLNSELTVCQTEYSQLPEITRKIENIQEEAQGLNGVIEYKWKELAKLEAEQNANKDIEKTICTDVETHDKAVALHKTLIENLRHAANQHGAKCKECGSILEDDTRKTYINNLVKQIEVAEITIEKTKKVLEERNSWPSTENFDTKIMQLQATIVEYKKDKAKLEMDVRNTENVLSKKQALESRINQINALIEKEKTNSDVEKLIADTKTRLKEVTKSRKEAEEHLAMLTALSIRLFTLKDGFKEVKQYVFQGLLTELTHKVNNYLRELFEVSVQAHFTNIGDEGSISKITIDVSLDGVRRPLGLYSGGQFRRIQLAVDLALSDIISFRSRSPIDIRILDEAFKDLSEVSMEKALKLLEQKKGTTLLIEHNSLFGAIVDNVFSVELRNKVSTRA